MLKEMIFVKILPLETNVPVKTLPNYAHPLGVMKAAGVDIDNWIAQNLISIYNFANYLWFDIDYFSNWDCFETTLITSKELRWLQNGFIDCIRNAIDDNWYLSVFINEMYIPFSEVYKTCNVYHEIFVNGYDNERKIFYTAGYDGDLQYRQHILAYDDFEKAFNAVPQSDIRILLYKVKKDYMVPPIDVNAVVEKLKCYLFSQGKSIAANNFYSFGISTYDVIIDDLKSMLKENGDNIVVRIFHKFRLLLEHKQCLYKTLCFISPDKADLFLKICKRAENIFVFLIKYNDLKSEQINFLIDSLIFMKTSEKSILEEVLKNY